MRAALEILDPEGELDIAWIALRPTRHETTALERLANGDAVTAKTLLADPAYRRDLKRFDREVENFFVATSVVSCRQETGWQKETTLVVGGRKYLGIIYESAKNRNQTNLSTVRVLYNPNLLERREYTNKLGKANAFARVFAKCFVWHVQSSTV